MKAVVPDFFAVHVQHAASLEITGYRNAPMSTIREPIDVRYLHERGIFVLFDERVMPIVHGLSSGPDARFGHHPDSFFHNARFVRREWARPKLARDLVVVVPRKGHLEPGHRASIAPDVVNHVVAVRRHDSSSASSVRPDPSIEDL